MATEKRLIDAIAYCKVLREEMDYLLELDKTKGFNTLKERMGLEVAIADLGDMPTVDAVEVDTVIEMFEYMLGDCPCNFSPVDEWLSERCELQNECPNPKDKRGCWKQFIKHFIAEMDGDKNV